MNKTKGILITIAGTLLLSSQVMAYMIDDGYYGGNDHGYGDVIGTASSFNIHGIDLSLSGTSLTVDIFTNFAGKADDGLFGSSSGPDLTDTTLSGSRGIGYGDLFLASAWNPYGTAPYLSDNHSTGTLWEYGLALDNRWWDGTDATGGSARLYALNGADNNDNALLSEDFMSGGVFRDGQEIAVYTSTDNVTPGTIGSWSVNVTDDGNQYNDYIRMTFDIGGTNLLEETTEIALHWAMTCGNDTIEGSWDVPEPSALSLMGLSLLGIGLISRRRKSA